MVSFHSGKLGGFSHFGRGDKMFLICHLISQQLTFELIKGSHVEAPPAKLSPANCVSHMDCGSAAVIVEWRDMKN